MLRYKSRKRKIVDNGNLVKLPSDIIRKIMSAGEESIEGMRYSSPSDTAVSSFHTLSHRSDGHESVGNEETAISPRWKALSTEHLSHQTRLPVINYFTFENEDDNGIWRIRMRLSERCIRFFRVQKWPIIANANGVVEVTYSMFHNGNDWYEGSRKRWMMKYIARIVERCARIEKFETKYIAEYNDIVKGALANVIVDAFVVSDSQKIYINKYKTPYVNFILAHSVQHLIVNIIGDISTRFDGQGLSYFFKNAMPSLSSIEFNMTEPIWEYNVLQRPTVAQKQAEWDGRKKDLFGIGNYVATIHVEKADNGDFRINIKVEKQ